MDDENVTCSLLKRLHDYNESLLDENFTKKQMRKKKQRKDEDDLNVDKDSSTSKFNRRKKKKERKKQKKELLQNAGMNENNKNEDICKFTGEKRTLFEMKNELGLQEFEQKLESEKQSTSEKSKNGKPTTGPEVVVYENPSKRKRKNDKGFGKRTGMKDGNSDEEFDMKRARYEVRKFGIKGFEGNKKDEAMVALLVQLGAKPPKNKFYNYKEFIAMKKTEKANEKIQREIDRSLGYKVAPNRGKRRQKDRNDVGGYVDGQVGKFKDGVQFVKRADLKGFASKRKK